ncbi:hypothetical protein RUM43_004857 [Polyplax serrata]|uniref:SUN domain-containing protein n=1 Tax=Polyplax serrata TaxID=468196 RepID=A0AAN8SBE3_POLSC
MYQLHSGGNYHGFWLLRGDDTYAMMSQQYKKLDLKTSGFLTSFENTLKPIWRSGYIAYKRAEASAACYMSDSWERLMLPFDHMGNWTQEKLSGVASVWGTLCQGIITILNLFRDAFLNLCLFLAGLFTDLVNHMPNLFSRIYYGLADFLVWIYSGLRGAVLNVGSLVYWLMFAPRETANTSTIPRESCYNQQAIDKLSSEIADFKSITWDLSNIKKKVDELELALRREKESLQNRNEAFDKRLAENHLTLQKYQASINHALLSAKRPGQVSDSTMQYFLDNHSNELKQWILQNFLLKTDTPSNLDEGKIALLIAKYSNKSGDDLLALQDEFRRFIVHHKSDLEALRKDFSSLAANHVEGGDVSVAYIKKLVGDAIKLYDADKTGRADYALETAGGQVHSIRCTETYIASPKSYILLGWAVYTKASSPRDAINPGMAAGQCWAFVGSQGFLVLQLSHTIEVTGFTMEHISRLLVAKGHIESAPKNFSMWGLKNEYDAEPHLFGEYTYLDNDETLQYFPVMYPTSNRYNMVELKITSNHGNPNYTCLYRIRVHGELRPIKV